MTDTTLRRAAVAATVVVLLGCLLVRSSRPRSRAEHRHGQYTRSQAVARAEALVTTAGPNILPATYLAEASATRRPDRPDWLSWSVVGLDARRRPVAFVLLDATSGELMILSGLGFAEPNPPRTLSRDEALWAARDWFRALGIGGGASRWSLARPPRLAAGVWTVYGRVAGRRAIVRMDAGTGRLLMVNWANDRAGFATVTARSS
ncbi:MAG: hypothetical protein IT208_09300 [Chthonomonadales bacterium]|nr:hypothetical protein [Chthonomonadales bacterium]